MSKGRLRALVVLTNLGMMASIGGLGCHLFGGTATNLDETKGFLATRFALDAGDRPTSQGLGLVWRQLDRPLPQRRRPPTSPPPPRVRSSWTLALAFLDPEHPQRSSGILVDPSGRQVAVGVGKFIDPVRKQVRLLTLKVDEAGPRRTVVATLEGPDGRFELRMASPLPDERSS